jgi:cyclopropane fatty-acyl-phospholipid synthase-like methyltransferase
MEKHYDEHYFFAEKYGPKKYTRPNGSVGEFGYTQGGLWNFEKVLFKLIELLGPPESILDIGAGCGGFVATCNANGIEALGLEFSQYAIDNAIMGADKYLKRHDLEQIPWPVNRQYDWVTAIDLFEHLFADKVDQVIAECKRVAKKWIITKICTAQQPHEVWSARRGSYEEVYEQARREGYEWLIVSGHVNSQFPDYWREKFQDDKWKIRDDLVEHFKRELNLPEDWRCTLVVENTKWFEEEFGCQK